MEEQIPDILYHYCSVDTFVKIIQNKTLRLSEIVKSNDSMECQWLEKEIVPPILERETESYLLRLDDSPNPEEFTHLKERIEHLFYWPYKTSFARINEKNVFAICLSEEPDLLSQWRGYATDGFGVAIGLDTKLFKKYYQSTNFNHFNFRKVIYNRMAQEKEIEGDIKRYIQTLDKKSRAKHEKDYEEKNLSFTEFIEYGLDLLGKSIYIKNECFSEEKEWRLFANFLNVKDFSDIEKQIIMISPPVKLSTLGVTVKSEKLMFYFDLLLDKEHDDGAKLEWIKKVYLGPKCKVSERDIRLILESNNWDSSSIEIIKSKATYV